MLVMWMKKLRDLVLGDVHHRIRKLDASIALVEQKMRTRLKAGR